MKELFLSKRWNRLMALASSVLIMLGCGLLFIFIARTLPVGQIGQTVSHYTDFRADLFLLFIGFFVGLISSIVLSLSKSGEEKDEMEKNYVKEATRELIKTIEKVKNLADSYNCNSSQIIGVFQTLYSMLFLTQLKNGYEDIKQEETIKVFLKGISNTLVVVYIIYENSMDNRNQIIKEKPGNWEQLVDDIDEKIDSLIEIKGVFHSTYERIEKIAIRHGLSITQSKEPKLKYLIYAEADMLKLLDKKKK